jgi:hypothetical protein
MIQPNELCWLIQPTTVGNVYCLCFKDRFPCGIQRVTLAVVITPCRYPIDIF